MRSATNDAPAGPDTTAEWFPPAWSLGAAGADGARVLVAEPRAALRRQIGLALRHTGLEVDFAACVADALEAAQSNCYGAAVVDPEMEQGRGLDLCAILSRGRLGPATRVIAFSSSATLGARLRTRLAGAGCHLTRPLALDRFVNTVWRAACTPPLSLTALPRLV